MPVNAFLALGSNLGDRPGFIDRAVLALGSHPGVEVLRVSSLWETRPVGGPPGQAWYLNGAAEVATSLSAEDLLETMLGIEAQLGRVRQERDGPRVIDLDLLLYGSSVLDTSSLTLPHPRMHERLFVLEPLAEIAPGIRHPRLGKTVAELKADLLGLRPFSATPGRELTGLRAMVTGSTSGIGKAIALALAAGGADVLIHGRRSREQGEQTAALARELGVRSTLLLGDVGIPQEGERIAEEAWNIWDGLDIWVNNAGADTLTGEAAGWSFERKLEALLAVDVKGSIFLSRAVGQRMKEAAGGVILNMGWDQAETGMEGDSGELFAAIKGAVMAFSRSLALSLAPEVRVHCLAPGWIRTAWGEGASDVWQERVREETPLKRWGKPEDVARMARYLASPGAAYLTGQIVRINGGAIR